MFDWLWKRVFHPKRISFLTHLMVKEAESEVKESIKNILQDEEVAQTVVAYGDALYDRYKKKVFSSIGGMQKGVNYAVDGAIDQVNPLAQIDLFDDEGNISLSNAFKSIMRKAMTNRVVPGQSSSRNDGFPTVS